MRALILTAAIISLPFEALASNPFEEAYSQCQEREARSLSAGIEISPQPLTHENGLWMATWADGSETALLSTEPHAHFEEGRMPFVIRYQGTLTMIVPWPATETEGVVCDGVPIS